LDYFHINSISLDRDGSLLTSSRNTWTVYKIDAHSGRIVWRLGGKHSSFRMGAGTQTAWQHDPRELPDGAISVFDNGAAPRTHPQSRAIVVDLDTAAHTATLGSQLTHTPPLVAESQGSMQELANGDWFVGWGGEPYFSEFDAQGQLLFDGQLPAHDESYRAYRFAWSGTPAYPPAYSLQPAAASGGGGGGTVYASWNGASAVASWRVLAGASASSLSAVAQAARSGFETAVALPAGTAGPYLEVQALDAAGEVLGTSPAIRQPALSRG
ncbi:MAG TPA: arylsulfotransferase family protein, partial [Solirubrobacteraceae bacterium]|nr:arylsulfotransferase family protein [Solirubrobacteraceae bacterium]